MQLLKRGNSSLAVRSLVCQNTYIYTIVENGIVKIRHTGG